MTIAVFIVATSGALSTRVVEGMSFTIDSFLTRLETRFPRIEGLKRIRLLLLQSRCSNFLRLRWRLLMLPHETNGRFMNNGQVHRSVTCGKK